MARSRATTILIVIVAFALIFVSEMGKSSKVWQMELVINIKEPIARDGGTIVVIPQAIPLHAMKEKNVVVEVSGIFSFVYFDFPDSARWTLRFELAPDSKFKREGVRFKLLSTGSGDYFDEHNKKVKIDEFQTFHVLGPRVTEQDSYAKDIHFDEYFSSGLTCKGYGPHGRVCEPKK